MAATPTYWAYLQKKCNWTQADLQTIHWPVLHAALTYFQQKNQWRLVLFLHNKLPLRSLKFHPYMGSILCPSCQHDPEDAMHFLTCQHIDWQQQFEKLKKQLLVFSIKHILHPSILTGFWLGLVTPVWNNTPYPDVYGELPHELQATLQYQQCLGWDQLFYGHIA